MMSLDGTDGGVRCGGVLTASREYGHAHDWIWRKSRREVLFLGGEGSLSKTLSLQDLRCI